VAYYVYILFNEVLAVKEHTAAKKIKSGRGASISFALFILLICAVVGSVVLGAATASAGRLSKLAESDKRYYSVNSAAELIVKALDGEEVTISGDKTTVSTTIVTYKIDDGSVVSQSGPTSESTFDNFKIRQYEDENTLLLRMTRRRVFKDVATEEGYFWSPGYDPDVGAENPGILANIEFELSPEKPGSDLSDSKVAIEAEITTDGRLHLILENSTSAANAPVYTIELFFTPAFNTSEIIKSSNTEIETSTNGDPATTITETTTVTEILTKTTTVSWSLSEIKKGE